jgi:hypothetical protein
MEVIMSDVTGPVDEEHDYGHNPVCTSVSPFDPAIALQHLGA